MRKSRVIKKFCITTIFVSLLAASASADPTWYDQNPAVKPGIPDIGWVSTDPKLTTGCGYCGYVAAANVITYWDSHGLGNLVPDGATADQLMSNLIGSLNPTDPTYHKYLYQTGTICGTSCDELESGLRNYFKDKGYGWMVIKQYNSPNINLTLIESELKKCEQVIIGPGALALEHWMTAVGWYDLYGDHWLAVHDPNPLQPGGANLGGAEDYYKTVTNHGLALYYGAWWEVHNIITVSVPAPGALVLALLGLSTVGILRRRKALR